MIRVGVAGLRRGASFATLFDAQAEATLVALCDSDTTALARAAARWPHATPCATYEELLAQGLDLVVVATGPGHMTVDVFGKLKSRTLTLLIPSLSRSIRTFA